MPVLIIVVPVLIIANYRLTTNEAITHARHGGGTPITVDLSRIGLPDLYESDFGEDNTLAIRFPFLDQFIVHGTEELVLDPESLTATVNRGFSEFNFEMQGIPVRDFLTERLRRRVYHDHPEAQPFRIFFRGTIPVIPGNRPWYVPTPWYLPED